jgi:hypothetical protein
MATSGSGSGQAASKAATDAAVARLEEQVSALADELQRRDDRQREIADEHRMLRERYAALSERYEGMAQAISVSAGVEAIGEGLNTLAAELAPLRQLVPSSSTQPAPQEVLDAIAEVREAAQAPSWEGVSTLGIPTWSIPWIGAPKPAQRRGDAGEGRPGADGQTEFNVFFVQGEQP